MRWDGSLVGFLDHVTGLLNLSWAYREGVVVIERLSTESFEITAFGGTQDYKLNLSGGNEGHSGFGSASAGLDVHETGKLAALDSLKRSLEVLVLPSGGSVSLNEGSGRFIVVAPKDVMTRVRELVRAEDASLRRQAHIQFDVYSVTRQDSDEYGLDWSGAIRDLARTWGSAVVSPQSLVSNAAAQLNMTLLREVPASAGSSAQNTATRYGGSKAVLQALHTIGESVQYRPVGLVAMNRQWARKTSLKVTGYVAETTPATATGTGSGSPGLKTASVTTGDKFLVQPAIMDDGTIFLKFGVSLTDLLGLFNVSAGSGASLQTVQTPETSGTDDQGTLRLNPGEAMVITGLSRRIADSDRNGLAEEIPLALGGSKRRSYRREDFLIVVRATPL
jgi:type IVB pilus formation R64 PilN family outer membrane protein